MSAPGPSAAVAARLRVVVGALVRRLREQSESSDLTRSQSSVLNRIERAGPTTATALARAEGMRPQSMGAIVAALEQAGLIEGSPDPGDGRKTILGLSDDAREQFRVGRLAREDWLTNAMESTLSATELEELSSAVDLLERITHA